jgi:hypothetical protein
MTPTEPDMCLRTGRLLTEWFEHPEYTEDDIVALACREYGIEPEDRPKVGLHDIDHPQYDLARKINLFIKKRSNRKWKYGMSQQEVQHRMNEATKMVSPDNYKFLNDEARERTGLEVNPLWMMECLIRSGCLTPKEQITALKELAGYTHSKAPSINHTTTTEMKPEDWLLELAKDEYKEIDFKQPMQPVERGAGKHFEARREKRSADTNILLEHSNKELAQIEAEFGDDWEDWEEISLHE